MKDKFFPPSQKFRFPRFREKKEEKIDIKMIGRSLFLGRNIVNAAQNQIVRHHSNGGIPGEVIFKKNFSQ